MFFEPIYGGLAASRALGMFRDFVVAGLGFREGGFIIAGRQVAWECYCA